MGPMAEIAAWSDKIRAALKAQADTMKRLNVLTPEHNGRVHAGEIDGEAAEFCANDSDHGAGTVHVVVIGELFELCPDCGVAVVQDLLTASVGPDDIDVEVYR